MSLGVKSPHFRWKSEDILPAERIPFKISVENEDHPPGWSAATFPMEIGGHPPGRADSLQNIGRKRRPSSRTVRINISDGNRRTSSRHRGFRSIYGCIRKNRRGNPMEKASSTRMASQAVPHPSTDRALRRLTSEFGRDPVYSSRYGR